MTIHSSILAWKSPWTVEPGGLQVHGGPKELDMTKQLSPSPSTYLGIVPSLELFKAKLLGLPWQSSQV